MWRRGKEALHIPHPVFSFRFKNVHSDWSCECTSSGVNVFERGVMLPSRDHAVLSAAVCSVVALS
jgi:hypothetical protein